MRKTATKKRPPPKRDKPANVSVSAWLLKHADNPAEIRSFCSRHDLLNELSWVVTLAKKTLQPRQLRVTLERDPEGSGEWLVLDVDMQDTVDSALAAYHRFKEKWLAHLPPDKRDLMRVVYNICQ